jgi:hypothetical protein
MLLNEVLRKLYTSRTVVKVAGYRMLRFAGHVDCWVRTEMRTEFYRWPSE